MSREGKKAIGMFESLCKRVDGRFVIGLPWKRDPSLLPNNYLLARQSLEKREFTTTPFENTRKMAGKSTRLRIVFDPACLYKVVSLNSFLYKGPFLIRNLLGVLLRFREEPVAYSGDISKMFLQIMLPDSDTQVHRFRWRNMDASREPTIYFLLRVTFGDKPSPDMASFVMLKVAEECKLKTPKATKIIERDRYVDDLIHSCSSVQDAFKRIADIKSGLNGGDFKIKEWH